MSDWTFSLVVATQLKQNLTATKNTHETRTGACPLPYESKQQGKEKTNYNKRKGVSSKDFFYSAIRAIWKLSTGPAMQPADIPPPQLAVYWDNYACIDGV